MNTSLENEPSIVQTTTVLGLDSNVKSEDIFSKDDAIDVAPNWEQIWWRLKKHRLALVSGVILMIVG
mgnify:CR=1 FL=1